MRSTSILDPHGQSADSGTDVQTKHLKISVVALVATVLAGCVAPTRSTAGDAAPRDLIPAPSEPRSLVFELNGTVSEHRAGAFVSDDSETNCLRFLSSGNTTILGGSVQADWSARAPNAERLRLGFTTNPNDAGYVRNDAVGSSPLTLRVPPIHPNASDSRGFPHFWIGTPKTDAVTPVIVVAEQPVHLVVTLEVVGQAELSKAGCAMQ